MPDEPQPGLQALPSWSQCSTSARARSAACARSRAVLSQIPNRSALIVVDDGSKDGTRRRARCDVARSILPSTSSRTRSIGAMARRSSPAQRVPPAWLRLYPVHGQRPHQQSGRCPPVRRKDGGRASTSSKRAGTSPAAGWWACRGTVRSISRVGNTSRAGAVRSAHPRLHERIPRRAHASADAR